MSAGEPGRLRLVAPPDPCYGVGLLVAGGAITVLLLPMTAALIEPKSGRRTTDDGATTSR